MLVEPGLFRTKLGSNTKYLESEIPDYKAASRTLYNILDELDGKQPGDPEKGVSVILDVVRGAEMPFRLPLGTDAYQGITKKCEETLALLKQHKDIICSTDILQ